MRLDARRWGPASLAAWLWMALGLAAVLGWPALATVREAWDSPTAGTSEDFAGDVDVVRPLGLAFESIRLVLATEAIALPLGVALGFLLFRTDMPGRRALLGLLTLAVFVPMPLHAAAWLGAFGNQGRAQLIGTAPLLVGWSGASFVHAMAALPWVVLLAGVGLRGVEPALEEAARLDLSPWLVVWRITLRRALGSIAGAALAVAVLTAGDMTVTDLMNPQVRTYAEEAYIQYGVGHGPASAAVVVLPPLIVLGACVLYVARSLLRIDPSRLASSGMRTMVWRLGAWRLPVGVAVLAVVGNMAALPIYGLLWRAGRVGGSAALGVGPSWSLAGLAGSFRHAWNLTTEGPDYILETSVALSAAGAFGTVALAWPLAWASRRPGPWRWAAAIAVALALATPGPVAGMALVLAYRAVPIVYDNPAILVLAYVSRTLPYALLILWPAIRSIPEAYFEAAALDGQGPAGRVWRIALPLSRRAIVAAWSVCFVLALGELAASHPVEPPGTMTLAKLVWGLLHTGVESHLAGVGLVMLATFAIAGLPAVWSLNRLQKPTG